MAGPRATPENGADVGIRAKPEADSAPASLSVRRGLTCCRSWGRAGRPSSGRRPCRPGRSMPWSGSRRGSLAGRALGGAVHPEQPGRHRREAVVGAGLGAEGRIIALAGEAGFQADLLRGGLHFGFWRWQYRIHKVGLVTVPQGKIGYVYARDGEPLPPSQTLGRVVDCNNFQDARAFLLGDADGRGPRAARRPARPAAGDPARRRLRDQPGPVRRHHRGRGLPPATLAGQARARGAGRLAERADGDRRLRPGRDRRHDRGARPAAPGPARSRSTRIGIVTVHDGPSLPPGRDHRPGGRHRPRRPALPQQLPGPRGVPPRRRPPRPAVRRR